MADNSPISVTKNVQMCSKNIEDIFSISMVSCISSLDGIYEHNSDHDFELDKPCTYSTLTRCEKICQLLMAYISTNLEYCDLWMTNLIEISLFRGSKVRRQDIVLANTNDTVRASKLTSAPLTPASRHTFEARQHVSSVANLQSQQTRIRLRRPWCARTPTTHRQPKRN